MLASTLTGVQYFLNALFLVAGIVFLVKGADYFVDSASVIAKRLKIPPIIIGLTIVSFGTSAPELAVGIASSIKGEAGLSLGNVVGSNIANLTLVLGMSILIHPIIVKKGLCKKEIPFLIIATVLLIVFSMDNLLSGFSGVQNIISRGEAVVFILGIVLFCIMSIKGAQQEELKLEKEEIETFDPLWKTLLLLFIGLIGIIAGAEFVTTPASKIATSIGVTVGIDEALMLNVVGLTVVAVGTSLPELVTSAIAAKRKQNEIAIGNVIGSNVFNILFICGITGMIRPLTLTPDIITDMIISLLFTILVFGFAKTGLLKKWYGAILLGGYVLYIMYIILRLFYPNALLPL
ncbi:MAG: calcium/sodium antiporter [Anaeroplasmataceae bacterium]|nr:calcium/sodium antiporter [Anaeroplasmataceae bacterium]